MAKKIILSTLFVYGDGAQFVTLIYVNEIYCHHLSSIFVAFDDFLFLILPMYFVNLNAHEFKD